MEEKLCPPALIKYTLFSTIASIAILVLSILSYGTLALWANIAASTLAILYHSAILFFIWRRSMDDQSSVHRMHIAYASNTLMVSALVLFVWLASLGSSIEQLVNRRTDRLLSVKRGPGKMEMQIAVTGLIFVEILVLGAWLVRALYIRRRRAVPVRQELEVMVERSVYSPSSLDLVQKDRKKKSRYLSQKTRYSTLLRHQSLFIAAKHEAASDVLQPPPPVATKKEDRPWSFLTPMAPASPSSGNGSRCGTLWD